MKVIAQQALELVYYDVPITHVGDYSTMIPPQMENDVRLKKIEW